MQLCFTLPYSASRTDLAPFTKMSLLQFDELESLQSETTNYTGKSGYVR
jgi:hypothetical protein